MTTHIANSLHAPGVVPKYLAVQVHQQPRALSHCRRGLHHDPISPFPQAARLLCAEPHGRLNSKNRFVSSWIRNLLMCSMTPQTHGDELSMPKTNARVRLQCPIEMTAHFHWKRVVMQQGAPVSEGRSPHRC